MFKRNKEKWWILLRIFNWLIHNYFANNKTSYTYANRVIIYLENPSGRHVGTLNNSTYFDAIKRGNLMI